MDATQLGVAKPSIKLRPGNALPIALCCFFGIAGFGCQGTASPHGSVPAKSIGIDQFASTGSTAQVPAATITPPKVITPKPATPEQRGEDLADLVATPGPPIAAVPMASSATPVAAPSGQPVLVDAKVGDINGRAVYASAILDYGMSGISPIGAELSAEAKFKTVATWRQLARRKIAQTLGDLIREELLRAEALQKFTPEQKMGFMGFMQKLQQDYQRQHGSSRAMADRNLRETEGITIDEWKRRQEDDELVKFQLRERILGRVNVNFRDIEQRYDHDKDRYDPPPRAVFRLVQVLKSRPEDAAAFTKMLEDKKGFDEAAKSPLNVNQPDKGGLELRDLKGPRSDGDFFPNPALNNAARTMKVGETVGPVELSTTVAWLHLDAEEDKQVSLYEAQLQIEDEIRGQRTQRELNRYIISLQGRTSMTDAEQMVDRLARIAEARYFPHDAGSQ